jgi:hypothetical protein
MKRPAVVVLTFILLSIGIHAQVFIEGSLVHTLEVDPGASYAGTIEVGNAGSDARAVRVYQTDYFFNADGKVDYEDAGAVSRSNGLWISFFPSRFTVPGNGKVAVTYQVEVPVDPEMVGTYWSMLMVEGIPEDSPEAGGDDQSVPSIGISQLVRYGVQIATHVGTSGAKTLKTIGARLAREEGSVFLLLDVQNTGERMAMPDVNAEAFNGDGDKVAVISGSSKRIYPETSVRYRLDLSSLDTGEYRVLVILDAGGDDVFGASYAIRL